MSIDFITEPLIKKNFKTVAEFEAWLSEQSSLVDKRFEFVNGKIIEKPAMKQEEFLLVDFLLNIFESTEIHKNRIGRLLVEADTHIDKNRKRIADLAYFTKKQMQEAYNGKKFTTSFAIELISPNDKIKDIEDKIVDYFNAKVKLVWYISPEQQQIYTYTSPTKIKIYSGADICSASPILDGFEFKVSDMFPVKK